MEIFVADTEDSEAKCCDIRMPLSDIMTCYSGYVNMLLLSSGSRDIMETSLQSLHSLRTFI